MGECDEALPTLLDRLAAGGSDVWAFPSFCIRRPAGTYQQNPLGRYPDLNDLPPEDYGLFDLAHMLEQEWLAERPDLAGLPVSVYLLLQS